MLEPLAALGGNVRLAAGLLSSGEVARRQRRTCGSPACRGANLRPVVPVSVKGCSAFLPPEEALVDVGV